MPKKWCSLFLGLFALSLTHLTSSTPSSGELFTSSFLVRFKKSVDNQIAHEVARRNGFHNVGPVSILADKKNINLNKHFTYLIKIYENYLIC